MIEINGLYHSLGGKVILSDINLEINDGTILGIVGVNGSGKSTLLRCMTGVYMPDRGTVLYDGIPITQENAKDKLFFLPDDPYYTTQMTCYDMFNMYSVFYPNANKDIYKRLVKEFNIEDKKPLRNFSKGMRRQVYVVCALSICPKYLLLDEAFDGLDPYTRKKVKNELIRMIEENNSIIIISSHSLMELESFCDSYILINDHKVASMGSIEEKTSEYCRFQLAFTKEMPIDAFASLPVVSLNKNGKFINIVLKGKSEEILPSLLELSPAVIEEIAVDFEEAIVSEIEEGRAK